jgi:hypothetical protein
MDQTISPEGIRDSVGNCNLTLSGSDWIGSLSDIVKGSPGSTPFPARQSAMKRFQDGSYLKASQLSFSDLDESLPIAPPPPNSPDISFPTHELELEAKRQEDKIKQRFEAATTILELFKPPSKEMQELAKRRRSSNIGTSVVKNEETVPTIEPYEVFSSVAAKEAMRRKRTQTSVTTLKKIVPGLGEDSNEAEVYEMTAKYIFFLKTKLAPDHDIEFLKGQIL